MHAVATPATSSPRSVNSLAAHGVWSPVLVPLRPDLGIDSERFIAHAHWLLGQGCHGLALFGTTSEANSFSVPERKALLERVVEAGISPERLMVGTDAAPSPTAWSSRGMPSTPDAAVCSCSRRSTTRE